MDKSGPASGSGIGRAPAAATERLCYRAAAAVQQDV